MPVTGERRPELTQVFQHLWSTLGWPIAQITVRLDKIAADHGLVIEAWDEDGLGPSTGCCAQLSTGLIVMLVELEHQITYSNFKGPTLYADAGAALTMGVEILLAEALPALGLSRSDAEWQNEEPSEGLVSSMVATDITRPEFEVLLRKATDQAIETARAYVAESLPADTRYDVALNQSNDRSAGDIVTFRRDDGVTRSGLTADEVVELLYRHGRCPVWVDVSAKAISSSHTVVQLLCSGRYTNSAEALYYKARGLGPFGVKSPRLPPGHSGALGGKKFSFPMA